MKKIIIPIILLLSAMDACKKNNPPSGIASLNVIPAALDVPSIYVYSTATPSSFYLQQSPIANSSAGEFGITAGPDTISIVNTSDTAGDLFKGVLDCKPGGIYSFYLTGSSSKLDTLFMQDQIPHYADSSAGVRFINLTPGSTPISINLAGNTPEQTEASGLGYKQISGFKAYPAFASVGGTYIFEIRNQVNDSLLTTFSWNFTVRKNNTIVISGLESTGLNIFQVNNF
jgi:hypothetical protein